MTAGTSHVSRLLRRVRDMRRTGDTQYHRNILTILTGSTVSQALPLLFSPIVTRLYTPADYGVLGVYMSLAAIGAVLVTSQYTQAIMLPRRRADVVNLLAVSIVISFGVALAAQVILLAGSVAAARLLGFEGHGRFLLLAPLTILLAGINSAFAAWSSRHRSYKRLSSSRILQAVATTVVQLAVGFTYPSPAGLIGAYIAGYAASTAMLIGGFYHDDARVLRLLSLRRARRLLREQVDFLLYVLPADLINTFTNQWPTLLLARFSGPVSVGLYSMSQRLLGMPMSLIGSSVVEVFRQRAIADYHARGECRAVFTETFRLLALLGLPPMLLLAAFGPTLFGVLFGSRWVEAGAFARVLAPMMLLRFVVSPLTYMYYIAGRQKEDFLLHLVMVATTAAAMWGGYALFHSALGMVGMFSANYCLIYLTYFVRSYQLSIGEPGRGVASSAPRQISSAI